MNQDHRPTLPLGVPTLATLSVALVTATTWYAIPALTFSGVTGRFGEAEVLVGLGCAMTGLGVLFRLRRSMLVGAIAVRAWVASNFSGDGFARWLGIGLLLRLAWGLFFTPEPTSDAAVYLALAAQLQHGGSYEIAGTLAYWPPGYPLLLSLWLRLPLPTLHAVLLLNLLSFVGMLLAVRLIGRRYLGPVGTGLAMGLLAVWPSLVMQAGSASKELILLALLTGAFACLPTRPDSRSLWRWSPAAGLLFGASCLVQPSVLLLPLVIPVYGWLARFPFRRIVVMALLFLLGAVVAVVPWTLRNLHVLGEPVLISTNGGYNFYRANNPLADGGFTKGGEVDLTRYDELTADHQGYKLGVKWIRENPVSFAALAHIKQVRFLGDDSTGAYVALREDPRVPGWLYYVVKSASTLFWALLWALPAVWLFPRGARRDVWNAGILTAWLVFFYFFAIHSVSESNAKYHLITAPFLAIVFAGFMMGLRPLPLAAGAPER